MLWIDKAREFFDLADKKYPIEYEITMPEQFGFRPWLDGAFAPNGTLKTTLDFASWIMEGFEQFDNTSKLLACSIVFCVGRLVVHLTRSPYEPCPDAAMQRRVTNQWARAYRLFVWLRRPPCRPDEDWRLLENTFNAGRCVEFRCVIHKGGLPIGTVSYMPNEAVNPYAFLTSRGITPEEAIEKHCAYLQKQIDDLTERRSAFVIGRFLWGSGAKINESGD